MPYKGWNNKKPNVAHLHEFGAPVWILLQGQKVDPKMQPKSKQQVYIGFDDSTRAVKYYNAEMCNVLTSRNFKQIIPPPTPIPENIKLTPDSQHKGETIGDMLPMGVTGLDDLTPTLEPSRKYKRNLIEDDIDINAPWNTCGICIDYKNLHNPYPEEENEDNFLTMEEVYAMIAGDELTSLKDTKNSPDWLEWEVSIQAELDLLKKKGTWKLVEKPPDAIPIANKWVFIKKHDKEGKVVRYRARLVAKECMQCPGYDYMETFSPVVRMDTLCAILALVAKQDLKLQQMDIKGAYLNGTLHETIYM